MKMPNAPMYLENGCFHITWNIPGPEPWPWAPPCRPIVHSTHIIGTPIRMRAQKYGIRKAPPPLEAALAGKRRKLPKPMAFPAMARTSPMRVAQRSGRPPGPVSTTAFFLVKRTRDMQ